MAITAATSVVAKVWKNTETWEGAKVPTAADDVILPVGAPKIECDTASKCKSLDASAYANELALPKQLTVGTATESTLVCLNVGKTATIAGEAELVLACTKANTLQEIKIESGAKIEAAVKIEGSATTTYKHATEFKSTKSLKINRCVWEPNGQKIDVEKATLESGGTLTRELKLGSSTILCKTWNVTTTGMTLKAESSTVEVIKEGTFKGEGLTYNVVTVGLNVSFGGSSTFTTLNLNGKTTNSTNSIKFEGGTTQTFTTLSANGASEKLVYLESLKAGEAFKFKKTSGEVCLDFLSLKDSAAEGGAAFHAGTHSTNVSGNSGWEFTACGGATEIAGVAKIRFKTTAAPAPLAALEGTTKLRFKDTAAATQTQQAAGVTKLRFNTAAAALQAVAAAGVTKVRFATQAEVGMAGLVAIAGTSTMRFKTAAAVIAGTNVAGTTKTRFAGKVTVQIVTSGGRKVAIFIFED